MKTFYLTDSGKVRDHNEDSVTILKNANNEHLLIVADGMGGLKNGEEASNYSVKMMHDWFVNCKLAYIFLWCEFGKKKLKPSEMGEYFFGL